MIGAATAAVLLLSVGLLCARQIGTCVQICAVQSLLAAITLSELAPAAAVLAFALNGVALPLSIARLPADPALRWRGGTVASWLVVLAVLVATVALFNRLGAGTHVSVGGAMTLLGLLQIGLRRHPLALAIGLLAAQNGLILVAGADPAVSLPAAVASVLPLPAGMALAQVWLSRRAAA